MSETSASRTQLIVLIALAVIVIAVESWRIFSPRILTKAVLYDGKPYLDDGHGGDLMLSAKLAELSKQRVDQREYVNAAYLLLAANALGNSPTTMPTSDEKFAVNLLRMSKAKLGDAFSQFLHQKYPDWNEDPAATRSFGE